MEEGFQFQERILAASTVNRLLELPEYLTIVIADCNLLDCYNS
jgi:hypothetical protein